MEMPHSQSDMRWSSIVWKGLQQLSGHLLVMVDEVVSYKEGNFHELSTCDTCCQLLGASFIDILHSTDFKVITKPNFSWILNSQLKSPRMVVHLDLPPQGWRHPTPQHGSREARHWQIGSCPGWLKNHFG